MVFVRKDSAALGSRVPQFKFFSGAHCPVRVGPHPSSINHKLSAINYPTHQNCTISAPFLNYNLTHTPTLTPRSMFDVQCSMFSLLASFHFFTTPSLQSLTPALYKLPIGPDSSRSDFIQLPIAPDSSRSILSKRDLSGPTGSYRDLSGPFSLFPPSRRHTSQPECRQIQPPRQRKGGQSSPIKVNQAFRNFCCIFKHSSEREPCPTPGGQSHGTWSLVEARKLRSNKRFRSFIIV
jgi:hypothetical protein